MCVCVTCTSSDALTTWRVSTRRATKLGVGARECECEGERRARVGVSPSFGGLFVACLPQARRVEALLACLGAVPAEEALRKRHAGAPVR